MEPRQLKKLIDNVEIVFNLILTLIKEKKNLEEKLDMIKSLEYNYRNGHHDYIDNSRFMAELNKILKEIKIK